MKERDKRHFGNLLPHYKDPRFYDRRKDGGGRGEEREEEGGEEGGGRGRGKKRREERGPEGEERWEHRGGGNLTHSNLPRPRHFGNLLPHYTGPRFSDRMGGEEGGKKMGKEGERRQDPRRHGGREISLTTIRLVHCILAIYFPITTVPDSPTHKRSGDGIDAGKLVRATIIWAGGRQVMH